MVGRERPRLGCRDAWFATSARREAVPASGAGGMTGILSFVPVPAMMLSCDRSGWCVCRIPGPGSSMSRMPASSANPAELSSRPLLLLLLRPSALSLPLRRSGDGVASLSPSDSSVTSESESESSSESSDSLLLPLSCPLALLPRRPCARLEEPACLLWPARLRRKRRLAPPPWPWLWLSRRPCRRDDCGGNSAPETSASAPSAFDSLLRVAVGSTPPRKAGHRGERTEAAGGGARIGVDGRALALSVSHCLPLSTSSPEAVRAANSQALLSSSCSRSACGSAASPRRIIAGRARLSRTRNGSHARRGREGPDEPGSVERPGGGIPVSVGIFAHQAVKLSLSSCNEHSPRSSRRPRARLSYLVCRIKTGLLSRPFPTRCPRLRQASRSFARYVRRIDLHPSEHRDSILCLAEMILPSAFSFKCPSHRVVPPLPFERKREGRRPAFFGSPTRGCGAGPSKTAAVPRSEPPVSASPSCRRPRAGTCAEPTISKSRFSKSLQCKTVQDSRLR